MAKLVRVVVDVGLTVPDPEPQSFRGYRPGVRLEVEVEEGETAEDVHDTLFAQARRFLGVQALQLLYDVRLLHQDPQKYVEALTT